MSDAIAASSSPPPGSKRIEDVAPAHLCHLDDRRAYATTTDRVNPLKIFKAQMRPNNSWTRHYAINVKRMIASENLSEASPVFQFIDSATYEREGGGYQEDVLGDLIDTELAQRCPPPQAAARHTRLGDC